MKNQTTFLSKQIIANIISAHDYGHGWSAIKPDILTELEGCQANTYLCHFVVSDECRDFLDQFITDIKRFREAGEGSNYARNFCATL